MEDTEIYEVTDTDECGITFLVKGYGIARLIGRLFWLNWKVGDVDLAPYYRKLCGRLYWENKR